jgi:osmoprotectant transport system permease protein
VASPPQPWQYDSLFRLAYRRRCLPRRRGPSAEEGLRVGSKRFTESYILGEILKQTGEVAGEASAVHSQGLGNTAIVLNALTSGNIDVYPEYTGTIAKEILKLDAVPPLPELNARLAPMGLAVAVPLGFNNTYAIAVRADDARAKGIARLSDLAPHPELKLGLSQEFLGRADGWPGLKRTYGLPFDTPRGLDHGLAYEAIGQRQVDAIDIYSTDAKLDKYGLTVLADDRNYFPRYDAVLLYRADLPQRLPRTWQALTRLEGSIDDAAMRRMNAAAELESKDFAAVAAGFLAQRAGAAAGGAPAAPAASGDLWHKLFRPDLGGSRSDLALVFLSLAAAGCGHRSASSPSSVLRPPAWFWARAESCKPFPRLRCSRSDSRLGHRRGAGVHRARAIRALAHRAQHARRADADRQGMKDAALGDGSGHDPGKIELPRRTDDSRRHQTSAVINVGTATIAAFISAGGYGERIVTASRSTIVHAARRRHSAAALAC